MLIGSVCQLHYHSSIASIRMSSMDLQSSLSLMHLVSFVGYQDSGGTLNHGGKLVLHSGRADVHAIHLHFIELCAQSQSELPVVVHLRFETAIHVYASRTWKAIGRRW